MSRSALWRQEDNVKERERKAALAFDNAVEGGRNNNHLRGVIPLACPDDTFNLHPMLLHNVVNSAYFQRCCEKLTDWNALVDEIYYEVKHMEPWTAGAHKSPSTAFCLLLRLFTLRCTEKQMVLMLDHVDSPYIRCIGFLYLRYAAEPASLWPWFEPYLHDEEPVQICQGKAETTVGRFAQMLLNDLDYFGTRLPRPPLIIERQLKVKLLQAEKVEERAKKHLQNQAAMEYFQKTGARIQALYGDDDNPVTWYDAVVVRVILRDHKNGELLARPKFEVTFPEYGNTELVTLGEVDLPGSYDANRQEGHRSELSVRCDRRNEIEYSRDHNIGRGYSEDRGRGFDNRRRSDRSRSRDRDDNLSNARREEQILMEEVLQRERDKTASKGRAYAARPATFKDSIGCPGTQSVLDTDAKWKTRGNQEGKPRIDRHDLKDGKPPAAPTTQKTPAELAAVEEKKRMLMARYG
ncbi:hypothetical protein ACHAW5_004703 [Stephanodiscus triporus]|uniref:Pre-mRNA-splicing factor 38 n=1 Tax=Stephanodiscus triporus TaxID=2934178 RepID=A0ABD3MHV0_9STRA